MIPPKRVLYLPIGISYEDIDFDKPKKVLYVPKGLEIKHVEKGTLCVLELCLGDDRITCSTCVCCRDAKRLHPDTYTIEVLK